MSKDRFELLDQVRKCFEHAIDSQTFQLSRRKALRLLYEAAAAKPPTRPLLCMNCMVPMEPKPPPENLEVAVEGRLICPKCGREVVVD